MSSIPIISLISRDHDVILQGEALYVEHADNIGVGHPCCQSNAL